MGAFGLVWFALASGTRSILTWKCSSALDNLTHQKVAIKKILKPFSNPVLSKRTFRELRLLKYLRHDNVFIKDAMI
jgi:serine/threonine protein kinase